MLSKTGFMNKGKTMDLSKGGIFSRLMIFALPLLAGQVFQSLYNSVDSIIIGNFESAQALAAVSASFSVTIIASGFFTGMSAGSSAMLARFFGAKDYKRLHDAVHTTMFSAIIMGVVLGVLGIIFTPALLRLTTCPAEIFEMATVYLRIYMAGLIFTSVYNIGAAILRSVGDSQSPFIFLVFSSLLNIGLDLLFVAVLKMGVAGVAIATIISQGISMILVTWKAMKLDEEYRFRFSHLMIDWPILKETLRLGLPAGIQSCFTGISNLFVQRYVNTFDSLAIAGIGSAMRIDQFAGMPCMTLGLAMTTFVGQNLGAGKNSRAHKSVGISTLMSMVIVVALCTPTYFFAPDLVRIFSQDATVVEVGTGMLRVIMPLYAFMGLNGLFGGILRGFRYSFTSMICSICGMVAARQLWLFFTLNYVEHNINFIYYGYPVGWFCSFMPMLIVYLVSIRKKYPKEPAAKAAEV